MQEAQPKYKIGTRIHFRGNTERKYKVSDYVYYHNLNTWYYWLRGVEKRSVKGEDTWVFINDAKQLTIESVDNGERGIVVVEK